MLKHLKNRLVIIEEEKTNKEKIIKDLLNLICENTDDIKDKEDFLEKIFKREEIGTTGIGRGIVVPHARCEELENVVLAMAVLKKGIEFNTPDGGEAKVVLLVGAPKEQNNEYLELLSHISKAFRDAELRNEIINSEDPDEIIEALANFFGA